MSRLPLTVVGGYLGAGKTTFINRLLTGDHGKRLMVMVNDFGAVNIDAALLSSVSGDTLELTNGCVCCTMGADLFMAVGDVLDRPVRPDHLIIEASGIGNPARIAEVARTEPELRYAGIVTLVDGLNFEALLTDERIAPQLEAQVAVADLALISKAVPEGLADRLQRMGAAAVVTDPDRIGPLLWDLAAEAPVSDGRHGHFVKWSCEGGKAFTRDGLAEKISARPRGLYRLKGFVAGGWEVQVVGKSVEIKPRDDVDTTALVGIGPEGALTTQDIEDWWRS